MSEASARVHAGFRSRPAVPAGRAPKDERAGDPVLLHGDRLAALRTDKAGLLRLFRHRPIVPYLVG